MKALMVSTRGDEGEREKEERRSKGVEEERREVKENRRESDRK